jgi:hypothetical protein
MKKGIVIILAALAVTGLIGYQYFQSTMDKFRPSQPSIATVPDTHCVLSSLPEIPDVTILSVTIESEQASHCKIVGVIDTEINFELLLPNEWNGKFVMGGGGGFVGSVANIALAYGAVKSGYATVGTDTGHSAHPLDGSWALNNPERLENFGHRAVHFTAVTAKMLISSFYAQPSTKNYFFGCSRGGGQALVEAQRYPSDFDGIVAGAPAYNWSAMAAVGVQIAQKMYPDPNDLSRAVVGPKQQQLIADGYLRQCDAQDGLEDGVLADPRQCQFDINSLKCGSASRDECLTEQQIDAMKTIYNGPTGPDGLLFPGFPFGGEAREAGMSLWMTGGLDYAQEAEQEAGEHVAPLIPNALFGFSTDVMKYMVFNDPDWDYSEYRFDNFGEDLEHVGSILNSTNPDLSEFRDHGGKLLIYHGWSDTALSPLATIQYYDEVLAQDETSADDVQLFLLPGVDHCFGGAGPSMVNYLTVLDDWVTGDESPTDLTAQWLKWNLIPSGSRLVCPYPQKTVYDGKGDPESSSSFRCVKDRS